MRETVGVTLWNKRRNEDILAETGAAPGEDRRPGETETTPVVWSPSKDASPSTTTTAVEMPTAGQEEEA